MLRRSFLLMAEQTGSFISPLQQNRLKEKFSRNINARGNLKEEGSK